LGRRVAEGGAGPGLHAGRAAADPGRADRRARRAGRVRGVSALFRAHGGPYGGAHLPPLQHGPHGRPDPRTQGRGADRAGDPRGAGAAGRALCGTVPAPGGGVSLGLGDRAWGTAAHGRPGYVSLRWTLAIRPRRSGETQRTHPAARWLECRASPRPDRTRPARTPPLVDPRRSPARRIRRANPRPWAA